ncbi:MAG: MBL fold metallo-hydrolase [Alphaproteobacteria bacterium]
MNLTFTILGCGSSGGVPRPGTGWGACDPANPKNRRRRCALLVERRRGQDVTRVLVDTGPDLREQLIDADVNWVDAVLYTHEHADHTHGIDDLRGLFLHKRRRVDVYADDATSRMLMTRFSYCFVRPAGSEYPPILTMHELKAGHPVSVPGPAGPIEALPFAQAHGDIQALGFRFGNVAYSADLHDMPDASAEALAGLDLWIVDALRYTPHPSHFSVSDALAWIERIKPKRAVLTNMHTDLDYETLRVKLPPHVEPAYDGMRIEGGPQSSKH